MLPVDGAGDRRHHDRVKVTGFEVFPVVCPPPFGKLDPLYAQAGEKSRQLGRSFAVVCEELACELLDLDGIAAYSDLDGIHLEADEPSDFAAAGADARRAAQKNDIRDGGQRSSIRVRTQRD